MIDVLGIHFPLLLLPILAVVVIELLLGKAFCSYRYTCNRDENPLGFWMVIALHVGILVVLTWLLNV